MVVAELRSARSAPSRCARQHRKRRQAADHRRGHLRYGRRHHGSALSSKASVQAETILGRRNRPSPVGDTRLRPGGDLPVEQTTPGYTLTGRCRTPPPPPSAIPTWKRSTPHSTAVRRVREPRRPAQSSRRHQQALAHHRLARRPARPGARPRRGAAIVGKRSGDITTLLAQANSLFGELQRRNQAIETLLTGIKDVSIQPGIHRRERRQSSPRPAQAR